MFETGISNNGIIVINRGDTFSMPLSINIGTDASVVDYVISGEDKVYFAICEPNQDFEDGVVRKILTPADLNEYNDVQITLQPSDTEHLLPGTYYYEIKLRFLQDGHELVYTIVPKRKLVIC